MYTSATQKLVSKARNRDVSDIVRLQALKNPEKTALVYEGHEDSYRQLNEHIDRAANALRSAGVKYGDRVAFLSHNSRSYVILRFAVIRAGAIFSPINFMLNADEVSYILDLSGASVVIAEDALCKVVDDAIEKLDTAPALKAYIKHESVSVPDGWIDARQWVDYSDATEVISGHEEDDPIQIMYTSGTESHPKGVLLSSRALLAQYVTCIVDGNMEESDVELHCMPLYHCAQLDCFLSVDLYLGGKSILMSGADAGRMLEKIESEGITKLFCPPTVWISLLRHPDFNKRNLSSLRKGYYGASIMPTAVIEELLERLPGLNLWNFYGQTELAPVATILKPGEQLSKLGSAGKPGLNINTRIVDDNDVELERGVVGEIVHQSCQAMLGYYKNEEKTAESFKNGWFHSGDLGYLDDDGFLYVVDRKKDMIKSGGENVSSREVEEVLYAHEAVAEVAVFALPSEQWIEAVSAVIVLREGVSLSKQDVDEYCREKLAGYKRPKNVFFTDSLPKNASGKILKRELREQYAGQRD